MRSFSSLDLCWLRSDPPDSLEISWAALSSRSPPLTRKSHLPTWRLADFKPAHMEPRYLSTPPSLSFSKLFEFSFLFSSLLFSYFVLHVDLTLIPVRPSNICSLWLTFSVDVRGFKGTPSDSRSEMKRSGFRGDRGVCVCVCVGGGLSGLGWQICSTDIIW